MSGFHVTVGEQVRFSKTVGESDIYTKRKSYAPIL